MVTRLSAAAVIVVAALITVSGQQANRNPNNPGQAGRADNIVPGQMLIRFNASTTTLTRNNILSSRNLTRLKRFPTSTSISWASRQDRRSPRWRG
jgi:predicted lipoprotein